MTKGLRRGIAAFGALILSAGLALAAELRPLAVSSFPNAKALPLWLGAENGVFERHGLKLSIDETVSSDAQREKLATGKIDIVQSAVDNALAMILAGQDVIIVMGGESGMNDFIARANINSFADFRGKTLVVDAPNTAYALQARKLLARAGLKLDVDYKIKPIGNASLRFRALMDSDEYAGAVMNPPFSSEALLRGMKSLGRMVDLLGPYQAGGAFLQRAFAVAHPDVVEAYVAGYVESLRWIADPAHKPAVIEMLVRKLKLAPSVAEVTYGQVTDPGFGFTPDARLDQAGFRNMLETRAETEGRDARLENMAAYVDESYYLRGLAAAGTKP